MTATDPDVTTTVSADPPAPQIPLTITDAAAALRSGAITSTGLTRALIERADRLDEQLGIYLHRTDEAALAAAEAADAAFAGGDPVGPLTGIPLGVKDIISAEGTPTTAQSLILDPAFAGQGDAPVVARLRAAGAVITGKLTTMEYAIGLPDPQKPFPIPRNPWNPQTWPGGSSSGTGNGVAAGVILGGLGTDTGGSVRLPASWCGISGLKQTFGRVPKSGCVPLGFSYDNIGPMARSAADCALMLSVMAGHDESDACSVDVPLDDYVGALDRGLEGLVLGVDLQFLDRPGDEDNKALFRAAVATYEQAGATIREVTLPFYSETLTTTMVGLCAEAFAYHRNDMQQRWTDYGAPTRMAIASAIMTTAADYVQAQRVRRAVLKLVEPIYADVDVILHPTCAVPSPDLDGLDFGELIDSIYTGYWNAIGYPAISIPMGLTSGGLPCGLHIGGRPFQEATVLRVAHAYQQITDFHLAVPPIAR